MGKYSTLLNLGSIIRCKRFEHHMTQEQLAKLSGISRQTVISIESGCQDTKFTLLKKIASILQFSLDDL